MTAATVHYPAFTTLSAAACVLVLLSRTRVLGTDSVAPAAMALASACAIRVLEQVIVVRPARVLAEACAAAAVIAL